MQIYLKPTYLEVSPYLPGEDVLSHAHLAGSKTIGLTSLSKLSGSESKEVENFLFHSNLLSTGKSFHFLWH